MVGVRHCAGGRGGGAGEKKRVNFEVVGGWRGDQLSSRVESGNEAEGWLGGMNVVVKRVVGTRTMKTGMVTAGLVTTRLAGI